MLGTVRGAVELCYTPEVRSSTPVLHMGKL